jgi:hypothetical protein
MMLDKLPNERQIVEVRYGNDWQPATYVDGEFIDRYGMPLDPRKISTWRMPPGAAGRSASTVTSSASH